MYDITDENEQTDPPAKGLEATRAHLNDGVLHRLFVDYSTKPLKDDMGQSKELRLIFLGTCLEGQSLGQYRAFAYILSLQLLLPCA